MHDTRHTTHDNILNSLSRVKQQPVHVNCGNRSRGCQRWGTPRQMWVVVSVAVAVQHYCRVLLFQCTGDGLLCGTVSY